ncbi:BTB/POZ domain-containing adapter for CUL3-mediated RhoA degradation protein 1 isoform X1 [Ursus arctos]|uniref:BTB/POZ domain-containing adapter for CUL3-mediated RhoA degradation protein 1 isoform X1 n=1 Tax=Ursus arctos TaxID=9644 RepID=UPI001CF91324|nr:BTB/POZ domain-containing adapter for CUL3-mediated RhoA degradation protein 1 isoform X1 [Ursus arctos]
MSAEASGPAMAEAPSLEAPKPSGLEPGSAAYGLKPLTPSSKYVKLNVGGSLHYTTLRTLTGQDTMLKAMFSGRAEVLTDAGGWVLIDRSGRHFGTILNYLRDGSVPLPESTRELGELLGEARYYLVQGLIEDCQLALQQKRENLSPLCLIPTVTSPREEQQLLASTSKPVVKLLHNRSNNKYSYTSTSDDNLLKNIELFDKLALRFHGRLLFLKDVLGDEICCWSFYGQGRKIAEVCCTSIVYATEKKQTKVRRGSGPGQGGLWWWAAPGPRPAASPGSQEVQFQVLGSHVTLGKLPSSWGSLFLHEMRVLDYSGILHAAHLGLKADLKWYVGSGMCTRFSI